VNVRCLSIRHVERGEQLADNGLLGERRRVDATPAGFVAHGLRVEVLPLAFELLHLGCRLTGAALEVLLRLAGRAQVAAQLLHVGLAIQREHGETGVFLLPASLLGDSLLQRVDALQPAPRLLEPRAEHRRLEGLNDRELRLGQRPDGFPFLRQLIDRGASLPRRSELSLQVRQPAFQVVQWAGAAAWLPDAMDPLLSQPVENPLGGPVRGRRVGQRHDRFLDAAGVFEPHHFAARDARGVRIDVAADAQQLAPQLQVTGGIAFEALAEVRARANV